MCCVSVWLNIELKTSNQINFKSQIETIVSTEVSNILDFRQICIPSQAYIKSGLSIGQASACLNLAVPFHSRSINAVHLPRRKCGVHENVKSIIFPLDINYTSKTYTHTTICVCVSDIFPSAKTISLTQDCV